jgi:hypothetical protein
VYRYVPILGTVLGLYHAYRQYLDRQSHAKPAIGAQKSFPLLFAFFLMSLGQTLSMLLTGLTAVNTMTDPEVHIICKDNAVSIGNRDGFTPCAVQSALRAYCFMGTCICWALICLDIFFKIVLQKVSWIRYWCACFMLGPNNYYTLAFLCFGVPIVPVAALTYYGMCGFNSGAGTCSLDNLSITTVSILLPLLGRAFCI